MYGKGMGGGSYREQSRVSVLHKGLFNETSKLTIYKEKQGEDWDGELEDCPEEGDLVVRKEN